MAASALGALLVTNCGALAETPSPTPIDARMPTGAAPAAGAQGMADTDGTVRLFLLTPKGELAGIILTDGTEVHTPPALSQALSQAVRPGDAVHVLGWRSPAQGVIAATSVTDARTGRAVVNPQSSPPPPAPDKPPIAAGLPVPGAKETTLQGRVVQDLHAPSGDLDGALLGDGLQLHLAPPVARQVADLLRPGEQLAVQGYKLATPYGEVMDVHALGRTPEQLTQVAPGPEPPPVPRAAPAPAVPPTQ
jgi:hypothetical protein